MSKRVCVCVCVCVCVAICIGLGRLQSEHDNILPLALF